MKDWKTTAVGASLAGFVAVDIYQKSGGSLDDWKAWVVPFLIAILGFVSRDKTPAQ